MIRYFESIFTPHDAIWLTLSKAHPCSAVHWCTSSSIALIATVIPFEAPWWWRSLNDFLGLSIHIFVCLALWYASRSVAIHHCAHGWHCIIIDHAAVAAIIPRCASSWNFVSVGILSFNSLTLSQG